MSPAQRGQLIAWMVVLGIVLLFVGPLCWRFAAKPEIPQDASSLVQEGNAIAVAMGLYRSDVGLWPEYIEDLEPKYLDRLPSGWEYRYWPVGGSAWWLIHSTATDKPVCLDSHASHWRIGLGGRGSRDLTACPAPSQDLREPDLESAAAKMLAEIDHRISRDSSIVWHWQGKVSLLVKLERREEAVAACEQMKKALPDEWWPYVAKVQLLLDMGSSENAIRECADWCDRHVHFSNYWHLSLMYRQANDVEASISALEKMAACSIGYDVEDQYSSTFMVYDAAAFAYLHQRYGLVLSLYDNSPKEWIGCSDAMKALAFLALNDFAPAEACVKRVSESGANTDGVHDFPAIEAAVRQRNTSYRHSSLDPPLVKPDIFVEYK